MIVIMGEKWYDWAYNTKSYLHGITLQYKSFPEIRNDHVHCEMCWDRISNLQGDLHGGYYDKESNSWICKDCFTELKGAFHWKESDIS